MKETLRNNPNKARKFNFTVRYIDDLTTNNPFFDDEIGNIYPKELQLKKTTEAANELSYLDIMIEIEDSCFRTDVYNKRDGFGFHVVNFPNLNIPLSPAYGVYVSQLVRMARICNSSQKFNRRNKLLTRRLLQQGFECHRRCWTLKKFHSTYPRLFQKFCSSTKSLIIEVIQLPVIARNGLNRHITSLPR